MVNHSDLHIGWKGLESCLFRTKPDKRSKARLGIGRSDGLFRYIQRPEDLQAKQRFRVSTIPGRQYVDVEDERGGRNIIGGEVEQTRILQEAIIHDRP